MRSKMRIIGSFLIMEERMREYALALGTSRKAKIYQNTTITFEALCERLASTKRTNETAEEYKNLPKTQRDDIKDQGGFVAGYLKDGMRTMETVEYRSMLTQDVDEAKLDFLDKYLKEYGYTSCIYSTHSHTPGKPRYRLITPLSRDVTPAEYDVLSRFLAAELGIEQFDSCSFSPNQLMYWPTSSSDAEYIFRKKEGELLNPDEFLANHQDYKECTKWPMTAKEEKFAKQPVKKRQQNPYEKKGIVGEFCRTMGGISHTIEKYLSDVYKPSEVPGRYDYINGTSTAGLVIYENDTFAYSFHATDPAYHKLCNAFDLVRIHKFPHEDAKESFSMMADFARGLKEVMSHTFQERCAEASSNLQIVEEMDYTWTKKLRKNDSGKHKNCVYNFSMILLNDPYLQDIAYNLQTHAVCSKEGKLPWEQVKPGWGDADLANLMVYIDKVYGICGKEHIRTAMLEVASKRVYHPIQEYLARLPPWDGVPRVDTLFVDYFGAIDNIYTRAASRKTLVAAVSRIYNPGTKFDYVPILNGPQGIGKSTFFAKLGGEWFSDSLTLTDMKDKTAAEKLQGYWIMELGELAGMRKTEVEVVKSFISTVDDKYRASYGYNVESHKRQCILVGTTNAESGFLRDITGNRRFWPIMCQGNSSKKAWEMTKEDVGQIWAETLQIYAQGEELYLNEEEASYAYSAQKVAMEADDREGLVREYLETPVPSNWKDLSLYDRRKYFDNSFGTQPHYGEKRNKICNMEIWCECYGFEPGTLQMRDSNAISAIMRKIEGWSDGYRTTYPPYGSQRGYKRNETA